MSAPVDLLIGNARANIEAGRFLQASDSVLDVAGQMLKRDGGDPELSLEIFRLRGVVARDRFQTSAAILHFDQARSIAAHIGNHVAMCEMTLAKATVAGISLNSSLAAMYLADAKRDVQRLKKRNRSAVLRAEIVARQVQQLEISRDFENAELIAKDYLEEVRKMEDAHFLVSRLTTLARIQMRRTGKSSSEVESWLAEADEHLATTGSALRELQWQVSVADFLEKSGDDSGAAKHALTAQNLLIEGQFRHRPAELLLTRHGLEVPYHASVEKEAIQVTYNIGGSGHNIAIGSSNFSQTSYGASAVGDINALQDSLRAVGIPDVRIAELEAAIKEDKEGGAADAGPGPAVVRWYQMVSGTAGKIAIGASGGALGRALAAYFGIG